MRTTSRLVAMLRRGRFEQEGFLPVDVPGGAALGLVAAEAAVRAAAMPLALRGACVGHPAAGALTADWGELEDKLGPALFALWRGIYNISYLLGCTCFEGSIIGCGATGSS